MLPFADLLNFFMIFEQSYSIRWSFLIISLLLYQNILIRKKPYPKRAVLFEMIQQ